MSGIDALVQETECRFSWAHYQDCDCARPPLNSDGHAICYVYVHDRCGRVHWCVPAAEADGTADNDRRAAEAAVEAAGRAGYVARGFPAGVCPHYEMSSIVRVRPRPPEYPARSVR